MVEDTESYIRHMILLMIVAILGYLWFNASPSKLLMGDAGSRAIGLFIAIAILKTSNPLLYLFVAIVLIIDGGLGLIKLTLIRVFKVNIMKNLRTPVHDHMRKNCGWSDAQVVLRFAIIQIMISAALIYALMI
jgi:phospho-N-acetylmuramoyl-pentapeptide-transferase